MIRKLAFLFAVALLAAASAIPAVSDSPTADSSRLTVAQDESSQEKVIERNLTDVHKLVVDEKMGKESGDMYLELPFKGDPMPKFRLTVDTQPLNTDKDDASKTLERGVLLNLYTDVRVPADKRAAVIEKINEWNRRKAFCSTYIDTDGEIICSWILNILSDGLPVEYVYDAVARLQNIWKGLYPLVAPELGLSQ